MFIFQSTKKSQAEVYEEIELLSNAVSIKSHWSPVDQLIKLGGINLILQIISLAHDWNFSGRHVKDKKFFLLMSIILICILFPYRCEMIKNALEVLNICAVLPKVQLTLCEPAPKIQGDISNDVSMIDDDDDTQSENDNVGLNIVIKAAEGHLLDPDIQKAALSVLITCVCAPIHRVHNLYKHT